MSFCLLCQEESQKISEIVYIHTLITSEGFFKLDGKGRGVLNNSFAVVCCRKLNISHIGMKGHYNWWLVGYSREYNKHRDWRSMNVEARLFHKRCWSEHAKSLNASARDSLFEKWRFAFKEGEIFVVFFWRQICLNFYNTSLT